MFVTLENVVVQNFSYERKPLHQKDINVSTSWIEHKQNDRPQTLLLLPN